MYPSVELQKAVFKDLSRWLYPVSEIVVPELKDLPMITIEDFGRGTNFTKTNKERFTFSVMVHGWSVGKSSIESKEIEEFIYQTLMNLSMTYYEVEFVALVMSNNVKEEQANDRVVFHSIQQFEITISRKGED